MAMNQAARLPLIWYCSQMICLINIEKRACVCVCVCALSVHARFWGSSLQMDWDLTGIPMSCCDGVMKSLPLAKIVFTLRRCLAVCLCARVANEHLNRVTSERRVAFFVVCVGVSAWARVPGMVRLQSISEPTRENWRKCMRKRRRSDFSDTDLRWGFQP